MSIGSAQGGGEQIEIPRARERRNEDRWTSTAARSVCTDVRDLPAQFPRPAGEFAAYWIVNMNVFEMLDTPDGADALTVTNAV